MDEMGIQQARAKLGEIADKAHYQKQPTVLTKYGQPWAVVVSHESWAAAEDVGAFATWQATAAALAEKEQGS